MSVEVVILKVFISHDLFTELLKQLPLQRFAHVVSSHHGCRTILDAHVASLLLIGQNLMLKCLVRLPELLSPLV